LPRVFTLLATHKDLQEAGEKTVRGFAVFWLFLQKRLDFGTPVASRARARSIDAGGRTHATVEAIHASVKSLSARGDIGSGNGFAKNRVVDERTVTQGTVRCRKRICGVRFPGEGRRRWATRIASAAMDFW
jgi:hypothetical protein